jgi:hypothetical protein
MTETRTCPFEGCDWEYESHFDGYSSDLDADFKAEQHYEREHAGKIRIQVTLESEQMLGDRDPKKVRENALERFESKVGYDVAHVRTEVLEESDDHARIDREELEQ